jgi:hypothetical protein
MAQIAENRLVFVRGCDGRFKLNTLGTTGPVKKGKIG